MKKFFNKKTAVICLILSVLLLAVCVCMIIRPISYGLAYRTETEYEGQTFEGTIWFYPDQTRKTVNSNDDTPENARYYYKDGYIFLSFAATDEEYAQEVEYINAHFEEALSTPFYADQINAFQLICGTDDFTVEYTCTSAIVIVTAVGIVDLALIGLTVASFIASKKAKDEN